RTQTAPSAPRTRRLDSRPAAVPSYRPFLTCHGNAHRPQIDARRRAELEPQPFGSPRRALDNIVKTVECGIDLDRPSTGRADRELHPAVGAIALGREVTELHAVQAIPFDQ